jgi:hypothetical protein
MSNLVPVSDIERMATAVAKSGLFGIKSTEQGVALMLIAQAEGLHPAIAARDYHVIQGRPALKADAMMARFQAAGGKVNWKVYTDQEVTGEFSHPQGGSVSITWTYAQATKIGLTGKDNWRNYPRAMLRARCISEGIRTVYPGCVVGTYTPEEVEDFAPQQPIKDITPPPVVLEAPAGDFAIYQPNGEVFDSFDTLEDWIRGYSALAGRVASSKKFTEEVKQEKLAALREANLTFIENLKGVQKAEFNSALVEAGVTPPKPAAVQVEDSAPSEQPF